MIFCFENYVKVKYLDVDMQPVLRLMWSVVDSSDYIDNSKRRETNQTHRCAVFRLDIDIHFIPKPPPSSRALGGKRRLVCFHFITSHISFALNRKPMMDISRSESEEMSVTHSESFSNSSFCPSKRVALNKSLFLAASAFDFPSPMWLSCSLRRARCARSINLL